MVSAGGTGVFVSAAGTGVLVSAGGLVGFVVAGGLVGMAVAGGLVGFWVAVSSVESEVAEGFDGFSSGVGEEDSPSVLSTWLVSSDTAGSTVAVKEGFSISPPPATSIGVLVLV